MEIDLIDPRNPIRLEELAFFSCIIFIIMVSRGEKLTLLKSKNHSVKVNINVNFASRINGTFYLPFPDRLIEVDNKKPKQENTRPGDTDAENHRNHSSQQYDP